MGFIPDSGFGFFLTLFRLFSIFFCGAGDLMGVGGMQGKYLKPNTLALVSCFQRKFTGSAFTASCAQPLSLSSSSPPLIAVDFILLALDTVSLLKGPLPCSVPSTLLQHLTYPCLTDILTHFVHCKVSPGRA